MVLLRNVLEGFFQKKFFVAMVQTFLGQKIYGNVIQNGRTNDQIILRWGRSFMNLKITVNLYLNC